VALVVVKGKFTPSFLLKHWLSVEE